MAEPGSPKRVAVIEDESRVQAVLVDVLEAAGYRAVPFGNGAEALRHLPDLAPDLILLDMLMPEMDGFAFLAWLRADPRSARVPVVIVSAIAESLAPALDRRAAEQLGVTGIFPKPFDTGAILEHVRRTIGQPV